MRRSVFTWRWEPNKRKSHSYVTISSQIWIQKFESEYDVYNVLNLCTAVYLSDLTKKSCRKVWTAGHRFVDMPSLVKHIQTKAGVQ